MVWIVIPPFFLFARSFCFLFFFRFFFSKADLWSVGCITFHLIAGEPPFECEDEVETMRRLLAVQYWWPVGMKVSR